MKTAIITDTNSGLTVEQGRTLGIFVLAMPVLLDGRCYMEGVDITNSQLYDALKEDRSISSSQPSPGEVTQLWETVLKEGYDEIVHIPMSSGLSGACQNAVQLAEEYGGKVYVADNHRISVTLMAAVLEAKLMADRGYRAHEIKEYLEASAYESSIYVTVNSLKYLKKSGRITPSAAAIANVLSIKPVLTIQGGKLDLFSKARGMKQSEKKMVEAIRTDILHRFSAASPDRLRIGAAGTFETQEEAGEWTAMVQEAFPETKVYYVPLSCSIACHVGVGAAGIGVSVADRHEREEERQLFI